MVVVAVDADDARAVDRRVQNFSGLEVGGNEDAGFETLLRGLRGDGIGQIAGGGAAYGFKTEASRAQPGRSRPRGL